ncbi:MAG: phosphotransacetylase family protein [Leptolyngbya sp. SIO1D8]|nr:phosphotransacetylase family protein [Leptolyngbya sp. SIO1D8]
MLIGSTEAQSGKSTVSLAVALQLQALGFQVGWGKPLASVESCGQVSAPDTDLSFIPRILSLAPDQQPPTLFSLNNHTLAERLGEGSPIIPGDLLEHYWEQATGDIMLLEGPSTLDEGALLNLSLPEITTALEASVILVMRFNTRYMIDQLIAAQKRLGDALLGVILNEVNETESSLVTETIVPYLEKQGIPVLATLPQLPFLRGMRVSEIVRYLDAEVLCCDDHLDLVVESLKIGAMNVNAALRFFGQGTHQAVVTGGDRRDLQIAALETSTHCLILTGQIEPGKDVIAFAQDKEVPILSVATDTLTTVERIDTLFGHVPLNNPDKVPLITEVLSKKIDVERLISLLGLEIPAIAPHS